MSNEKFALYDDLRKAQQEMTAAMKDTENPHFRSKYADLGAVQAACLPALHKHGFAVFQPLVTDETGHWVETIFAHESGETLSCRVPLLLGKHDMQGLGSAVTYARRYGLLCMSGVAPEDDDGNKAAEQGGPMHKPRQRMAKSPAPETNEEFLRERHETDVAREMAKIGTITDIDELSSYWKVLNKTQPEIAADQRMIDAKDERKSDLFRTEKEAAE